MSFKTKALKEKYIFSWGKTEVLEISGPAAKDFLHRLSTVNFKNEFAGSLFGAFINGQAKLISLFTAWTSENKIHLFIEPSMVKATKSYLDQMHFAEKLEMRWIEKYVSEVRNSAPPNRDHVQAYNWGLPGYYIIADQELEDFADHKSLSEMEYDSLRAAFAFAKPLKDFTTDHLFVESGLESLIDRNKGCYPGQEVVEKVYTYGRLPKKIFAVLLTGDAKMELPFGLVQGDSNIGMLTSVYFVEGELFGFATLKRNFFEKNQTFKSSQFEMSW